MRSKFFYSVFAIRRNRHKKAKLRALYNPNHKIYNYGGVKIRGIKAYQDFYNKLYC